MQKRHATGYGLYGVGVIIAIAFVTLTGKFYEIMGMQILILPAIAGGCLIAGAILASGDEKRKPTKKE